VARGNMKKSSSGVDGSGATRRRSSHESNLFCEMGLR
jgi:hypothetical protein